MTASRRNYVLVVEDDADLADAVGALLETDGHAVTIAADGEAALHEVELAIPSLIILDMFMPVMDGWEFARQLAARYGHCAPILVMTAAENPRERASAIGADDVLAKPFDVHVMLAIVRRLVRREAARVVPT